MNYQTVLIRKVMVHLLLVLLTFCAAVKAQDAPRIDLSLAYSYVHVSASPTTGLGTQSLHGGELSVSYRVKPWLRVVGDFGLAAAGYRTSDIIGISLRGTQSTYLIGPRFVYTLGRFTPFAQGLFGVAHANAGMFDTPSKQTDFAYAIGGGFDYRLTRHFALRPIQLEYLRTNFFELQNSKLTQKDLRASTGIVFRF
jgi:opacity protein-like surface antigen